MSYDTQCTVCENPIMACSCEAGPTPPESDKQCTVCGSDPNTERYRTALYRIMTCRRGKDAACIAEEALYG